MVVGCLDDEEVVGCLEDEEEALGLDDDERDVLKVSLASEPETRKILFK